MSNNWNGKGLPEVGSECEYEYTTDGEFWKCRIMGYNGNKVAFTRDDHSNSIFVSTIKEANFRPIKSDRDKAVDEMAEIWKVAMANNKGLAEFFSAIYDAGFKKQSGE